MGAPGQAKTGGRKAGTPDKKTAALKQAVVEAVGALPDAFEGDSYAFLATVYKNQALPLGVRLDAAKTAIAYERARLAHVAMTTRSLDSLSDEEFFRAWDSVATFLAQHGRPRLLEQSARAPSAEMDAAGRDTGGRDDAG
jgi:hypothetical protein